MNYQYARGNPISLRDPSGNDPLSAAIGFVGGLAYGYVSGVIEGQSSSALYEHALEDAAFGGLTGLTDGLNLVGALATNVAINSAGEAFKQGIDQLNTGCGSFNATKIALAGVGGLLGDLGGKLVGSALFFQRNRTHSYRSGVFTVS